VSKLPWEVYDVQKWTAYGLIKAQARRRSLACQNVLSDVGSLYWGCPAEDKIAR